MTHLCLSVSLFFIPNRLFLFPLRVFALTLLLPFSPPHWSALSLCTSGTLGAVWSDQKGNCIARKKHQRHPSPNQTNQRGPRTDQRGGEKGWHVCQKGGIEFEGLHQCGKKRCGPCRVHHSPGVHAHILCACTLPSNISIRNVQHVYTSYTDNNNTSHHITDCSEQSKVLLSPKHALGCSYSLASIFVAFEAFFVSERVPSFRPVIWFSMFALLSGGSFELCVLTQRFDLQMKNVLELAIVRMNFGKS